MRDRRQAVEIVFDHATKRYPGRASPAVDDLTMTIPAGDVCCLVGPSGGGKTTAMKLVNRLVELTSGDVRVDGRSVKAQDETALRRGIAILREGGVLVQYDTPEELLAHPADDYVARFVGADRGLKRLSLTQLDELELEPANGATGPVLDGHTTLRDALSTMLNEGTRTVVVEADDGTRHVLTLDRLTELLK